MNPPLTIEELAPWIERRFDRSGGPGGQNVNKLSTRATVLLDFERCPRFDDAQRARIRAKLGRRCAADGRLRVVSQDDRSQRANTLTAEARLLELIAAALATPRRRIETRPTRASRTRRLTEKRKRADVKRERGRRPESD